MLLGAHYATSLYNLHVRSANSVAHKEQKDAARAARKAGEEYDMPEGPSFLVSSRYVIGLPRTIHRISGPLPPGAAPEAAGSERVVQKRATKCPSQPTTSVL